MSVCRPPKRMAKVLVEQVFCRTQGFPQRLLSNRGLNFSSEVLRQVCVRLGVKRIRTTAFHPQGNGQCERFNSTLGTALRKTCLEAPQTWDKKVALLAWAYNTSVHSVIGVTPYQMVYGDA